MYEIIEQIKDYIRGIWLNRWYITWIAWLICIIGWFVVIRMPDQYDASAKIYIDTETILRPLLKNLTVPPDLKARVLLMTKTLFSTPNLKRVARMTDLDLDAKNEEELEKILHHLEDKMKLIGVGRQNLYEITYTGSDPQLAKLIVQSFLTIFVESALGDSRRDSDIAQRFLKKQIRLYERRLIEAEKRLKDFKRKHMGKMPGEGSDYYQQLRQNKQILEEYQLQLNELVNRRNELELQLESLDEEDKDILGFEFANTAQTTVTDPRVLKLQEQLDDLLLKYTEKHPDVIAVQDMLDRIQQEKQTQLSQASGVSTPELNSDVEQKTANPVYQQLKIALGETEANIASMRTRVEEYKARIEKSKQAVDTTLEVEAELTNLNRDYDVHKQNYEALLARLEAAKMSESMEQNTDEVQFKVVDPPSVSFKPTGPPRAILSSLVLAIALGFGIAIAFLISQFQPVFTNARSLKQETGIPVLGQVSMVYSRVMLAKRRFMVLLFLSSMMALLATYALLILIYVKRPEWISYINNHLTWLPL